MRTLLTASTALNDRIATQDIDLIRKYRNRLSHDKHLLDEPEDRSLCAKLISIFNIELRARAATSTHERYLAKRL
jgi:hypothetical protein